LETDEEGFLRDMFFIQSHQPFSRITLKRGLNFKNVLIKSKKPHHPSLEGFREQYEPRDTNKGRLISLTHGPLSSILQTRLSSFEMITKQGLGGSVGSAPGTFRSLFPIECRGGCYENQVLDDPGSYHDN
jgi:hypothetical protein